MSMPEAAAVACLLLSAIAAMAGHWKLGAAAPVWDAASMYAAARGPSSAKQSAFVDTRLAMDVLIRSAEHWQGQSHAALVHEALGRIRVQDGDFSGALKDIRQAVRVTEPGHKHIESKSEEAVLDSVRARAKLQEAELLLLTGDYVSAIDAIGDSISAGVDHWARPARLRVEGLKVLITAAVRMSPSAEELAGIQEVFEKTKESIREKADPATNSLIYDVTALLAEARNDVPETIRALGLAISHCRQATNVGDSLKRSGHRKAGDAGQAAELAALHARLSQVLHKRAVSLGGDLTQAHLHKILADKLTPDTGHTDIEASDEGMTPSKESSSVSAEDASQDTPVQAGELSWSDVEELQKAIVYLKAQKEELQKAYSFEAVFLVVSLVIVLVGAVIWMAFEQQEKRVAPDKGLYI